MPSNGDAIASVADMTVNLARRLERLETEQRSGAYLMSDGVVQTEADCRIAEDGATMGYRRDAFLPIIAANVEHFNGVPSGWSFFGAPFAAGSADIEYGHLRLRVNSGGDRLFFGMDAAPTALAGILSLSTNSDGDYVGIRMDDGGDSYYVEYVVEQYGGNGGDWRTYLRWRNGGGVSESLQRVYSTPAPIGLRLYISGAQWSNWNVRGLTYASNVIGAMWDDNITGLSWTPARFGVVASLSATWQRGNADAVFWAI